MSVGDDNDMTVSVGVDVNAGNVADQLDELAEEYAEAAESLREGEGVCTEENGCSEEDGLIARFKEETGFYEDQTQYESVTKNGVDFVLISSSKTEGVCFSKNEMETLYDSKWTIRSIGHGKLWCVRDDSPSIESEVREVIEDLRSHHCHTAEGAAARLEGIVEGDNE